MRNEEKGENIYGRFSWQDKGEGWRNGEKKGRKIYAKEKIDMEKKEDGEEKNRKREGKEGKKTKQ